MPEHTLRFLSAQDIKKALSMRQAIGLMKDAFVQLSGGQAVVPLRMSMEIPETPDIALFMPVYLPKNRQIGLKSVSIMRDNSARGLPYIHALMLVMDAVSGRPLAIMDGEYLTALRTGAASGLATDMLARKDTSVAAIFGTGAQARTQLEALCSVRDIKKAYIFATSHTKAGDFAREMSESLSVHVVPAETTTLLKQSDVICTATTAHTPVFSHEHLRPGVHINAIGAYTPKMREVPGETVCLASVFVDQRESCLTEAGDIIIPLTEGLITRDHIRAEIGEIVSGREKGRISEDEITLFKSVGNATQDLAAASQALVNAKEMNLGVEVVL